MTKDEKIALISLPVVLLIGWGFALAGSSGEDSSMGLSSFAVCVMLAFLIQFVVFLPSFWFRTEKFYDLTGSLTYISVAVFAIILSSPVDARSLLLMTMVLFWSIRLGSFLFHRIHKDGKDGRFDQIKTSFLRFLLAWTMQGLWVTFTMAAALAAMTTLHRKELGWFALVGSVIWLLGFAIEVIADAQKSRFKANPKNKGAFIRTGLWSKSRHPNYFGEILLWIGVAIIAFPVLQGWQYLTLTSPLFVALLLIKISGIPLLEKRADQKWGGDPDYETYKQQTPVLVPKL